MDKFAQDGKTDVGELILQRDQERKAKLKCLREEKESLAPDESQIFQATFDDYSTSILENIKLLEEKKIDSQNVPQHIIKLNKDLEVLNRYLSVTTPSLANYVVRKSMQTVENIGAKIKELETELFPRKKFGLKQQKVTLLKKTKTTPDQVDADARKIISFPVSCGFADRNDENLTLSHELVSKKDVELRNLNNCTIFISGNPNTVHISNIIKCKILCGPVTTAVFVENCRDSDIVAACQQMRIHTTTQSRFYIHTVSNPIVEDSSSVNFAPYNLKYEGIEEHYELSCLDKSQNNWNQVNDFNWLVSDVKSPNWEEIKDENRISNWFS